MTVNPSSAPDEGALLSTHLHELAQATAYHLSPLPPEVVRQRGHQRRMHRQVALATAAVTVLVALVGAAVLSQPQDMVTPQYAGPAPATTSPATVTASPTGSTSSSPTTSPSSLSPSSSSPSTPGASTDTTTTSGPPSPPASSSASPISPAVRLEQAQQWLAASKGLPQLNPASTGWSDSGISYANHCLTYTMPGFINSDRLDRYSTDGQATWAWQSVRLPGGLDQARQLYQAQADQLGACTPHNLTTVTAIPGVEQSVVLTSVIECQVGITRCSPIAHVAALARVHDMVVYVEFARPGDFNASAAEQAALQVISRARTFTPAAV